VKEIEVLLNEKLSSPRLVKYYSQFSEGSQTHIIMECCEKGGLDKWIKTQPTVISQTVFFFFVKEMYDLLFFQKVVQVMAQVIDGLNVIHANNMVHGDVKMPNILFDRFFFLFCFATEFLCSNDNVKISDFGSSQKVTDTLKTVGTLRTVRGTIFRL
jgi:serine/threonine protein kinase